MTGKGTILVVDDTLTSLKLLTDILAAEGYEIRPADSGELALASVASSPPELILLDIRMPGMDGFEVCRQLKEHRDSRGIPVLFISATPDQGERLEGLRLGAVDFISKPFQREELLARVRIHLELARLRTQLENQVAERTAELSLANERLQHELEERKRTELSLKRAKEAAEAANRVKDRFIAVLSHELRTPLTPVLASVTALELQEDLPKELRSEMAVLRRNLELEARLIDDLLTVTRLSRGKIELHNEVVDAHRCLQASLEICRNGIEAKRLEVSQSLRATQFHVWADPKRLQQVFWNLIENAVKFTPDKGRIDLRSTNDDGHLKIEIADTGIGIEPEVMPLIFNAFEQGEKDRTRRFGGMGLGLSIAKSVVDMHHGSLAAFSEGKDKGATFTVELTVIPPETEEPPQAPSASESIEDRTRKLLLVEDHPDTLHTLTKLLERWGYQVTPADCVRQAVELAAKEPFDLLISDLGLPDGDGVEIMQNVKGHYGLRGIALSGFGTDEDIRRSLAAGFEEHLVKPVNFPALRAAIQRAVSHGVISDA